MLQNMLKAILLAHIINMRYIQDYKVTKYQIDWLDLRFYWLSDFFLIKQASKFRSFSVTDNYFYGL